MKMQCRDTIILNCPGAVQKEHKKIWGMKTLKMCFGKGRLKQRVPIEQGIYYNVCILNQIKILY